MSRSFSMLIACIAVSGQFAHFAAAQAPSAPKPGPERTSGSASSSASGPGLAK